MKKDGGPAFPGFNGMIRWDTETNRSVPVFDGGMTLRQYAAIKLKVPDSGTDWLDEMIIKSKRDDLAIGALNILSSRTYFSREDVVFEIGFDAYDIADAMLKAREQ